MLTSANRADPIEYTITITEREIIVTPDTDVPNTDINIPNTDIDLPTNAFYSNLGTNPNDTATTLVALGGTGSVLSAVAIVINIIIKKRIK